MLFTCKTIILLSLSVITATFLPGTMSTDDDKSPGTATLTAAAAKENVLVFGGNGFMGSELVHNLIQMDKYNIIIVSRGSWYFDSATRIKPFVTHISCDRENSDLEFCEDLIQVVSERNFKFVFDFSAYKPEVLEASVELLNNKTDLYVYVSSDSVYEVCENRSQVNGGLSREEDAVRPESSDDRDRLNDLDEYGNEKLEGEEVLVSNRAKGGCPYLILRLPDVIGPRDTTERIWTYIMWIQFFDFIKVPIFIPRHVHSLKTSFVYVKDVVKAMLYLLDQGVKDDVFNVGFEEPLTLHEFLKLVATEVGKEVQYTFTADESFTLFPSVTRGGINVTKIRSTGFLSTPINIALHETVQFYKNAFFTFESERDDVVHQLTRHVLERKRKGEFLAFIDKLASEKAIPRERADL